MIVPEGHRAVCPTCGGGGGVLTDRAALAAGPRMATATVGEKCKPCEGTGWIPPKHDPADEPDEPDGD